MAASVLLSVPLPASPEAGCTAPSGQNSPESAASPNSANVSSLKRKKKPYKELTLEEKVNLIKMAEENNCMSQASIAERYSIAKSNVCRILQRKNEYLQAYESAGFAGTRKRKLRNDCAAVKSKRCDENLVVKVESEPSVEVVEMDTPKTFDNDDDEPIDVSSVPVIDPILDKPNIPPTNLISNFPFNPLDPKSAFQQVTPCENTTYFDPHFFPSNFGFMPFTPLATSYTNDSALQQAKATSASTMFLNHALIKHIELLSKKISSYERKHGLFRSVLQDAENSGLLYSSDAQQLLRSLLSIL
uniref:HTH psq-type domain-containing protein n=1 Tax=Panagrellus redivivus TaxID=6233 RepID=A0A7E4VK45_PANRE